MKVLRCGGSHNSFRADVIEAALKEVWPRSYEESRRRECMLIKDLCLVFSLDLFVPHRGPAGESK